MTHAERWYPEVGEAGERSRSAAAVAVPERPSRRGEHWAHAAWRVIEVELHSMRCLYVVARARGEGGGPIGVKCMAGNPSKALPWRDASLAS